MKNLLRIGQVSNLYNISLDTLRHYDKKDLLKPIVDNQNGYRYYSFEHLDVLEMILVGKYLEIPLDKIKEKIDSESIDGYIDMIDEQKKIIKEKLDVLMRLNQYASEMKNMLTEIKSFSNDNTFSKVNRSEDLDITIYQVNLANFLNKVETSELSGIESFDQWISYNVDNKQVIIENSEVLGLSIHENSLNSKELLDYLNSGVNEEKILKFHISNKYRYVSFSGTDNKLQEYLQLLCSHFNLKNTTIHVKFSFALLHKDMHHEYFAEIYFNEVNTLRSRLP